MQLKSSHSAGILQWRHNRNPIDRTSKRATMLCAIADRRVSKPGTAVPRKPLEEELFQLVYIPKMKFHVPGEWRLHLGALRTWIEGALISCVRERRRAPKYTRRLHRTYEWLCAGQIYRRSIISVFLTPQLSDQTQPLDLGMSAPQRTLLDPSLFQKDSLRRHRSL